MARKSVLKEESGGMLWAFDMNLPLLNFQIVPLKAMIFEKFPFSM
jgi:hypothetical protein